VNFIPCQNHIIGVCAGTNITSFDDTVVKKFLSNLTVFTTSKKQVNHPGFMYLVNFCPECGLKINDKSSKSEWDELIENTITRKEE
jgi:hypothetical protein